MGRPGRRPVRLRSVPLGCGCRVVMLLLVLALWWLFVELWEVSVCRLKLGD